MQLADSRPLLRHQRQRFSGNCGPTCVAIIADISQDDACMAMFDEVREARLESSWRDIKRALRTLDIPFAARACFVRRWTSVSALAIVACSRRANGDHHFVVCSPDEALIYDPLRSAPVSVTRCRRQPFSYLAISRDR